MSDLVQKIADAVDVAWDKWHRDADCERPWREVCEKAIRQSLGSTQERGEAVAPVMWQYRVYHTDPDDSGWGIWHDCHDASTATRLQSSDGYQVRPLYTTPDAGRVAELEREQQITAALSRKVAALEAQLAESREREGRMRAFIEEVSKQTPEKPDYWSSCGQCSHNQSDAEDIIDALAADKEKNDE